MIKAIILIILGMNPQGSIHVVNGGVFMSTENCVKGYEDFKAQATSAGLDIKAFRGVCYQSSYSLHGPRAGQVPAKKPTSLEDTL
jgi:hypothetical protein